MVRSRSFLLTLPVELVHCILDYLDIDTILFSFRYVCKTFYLITKIYNRLTLELSDDPWETPFDYLNEIISYENVERLILQKFNVNNELNNINQFFSLSEIHRLTRLRCVILVRIDENNFRTIMCHLATLSTLKSLAIYERRIWKNDTNLLLSTVLALPSLRQIHLDVHSQILDEISWPNPGKFRELILKNCSYKQWCHILSRLSNLQIVSVGNFDLNYIEKRVSSITTHWQLTSLTLSHIQFPISQLEMVLSSYPSLLYLNFTAKNTLSFASLRQFSRWERFLGDKLPRLKHFHFEISSPVVRSHEFDYIKTLIAAFRTPFWLQYKHWYTKFQYVINNHGARFIISSLINEHRDLFDKLKKDFLLFFTSTREDDHGWNANFNLSDMEQAILSAQFQIPKNSFFDNVIRLALDIDRFVDWQRSNSLQLLSKLIDLSQLTDIWFLLSSKQTLQANTINIILEKAPKVRHFGIRNNGSVRGDIQKQYASISRQIDYFTVQSSDRNAIEHFTTITFTCDWTIK